MNKFLSRNNNKKNAFIKIFVGFLFLIIFVVSINIFEGGLRKIFYSTSGPLQKSFLNSSNSVASILQTVFNSGALKQENENLKIENQKLSLQILTLKNIAKQQELLDEVLKLDTDKKFKIIQTDIISFNLKDDFITINKGKNDGIKENMPLINSSNILFGKIFKVYENFSEVMLLSNKISVLDVKVQKVGSDNDFIYGAIKGKGSLSVFLDLVPSDLEINKEDILLTSALDGAFPKDLLVGKITQKQKDDLKPFQTAEVLPFFDIKKTDSLFVVLESK